MSGYFFYDIYKIQTDRSGFGGYLLLFFTVCLMPLARSQSNIGSDTMSAFSPMSYSGYKLLWHDEFTATQIDTSIWGYDLGGNGWGNNELEYYTNSPNNSYISNGMLVIEARKEKMGGRDYTSARMLTQRKKEFTYGRIDMRAKIPTLPGMWPALWMLGANIDTLPWPFCGETDIMEVVGKDPWKLYGTLHFADSLGHHQQSGGTIQYEEDFSKRFHVYSLNWTPSTIEWLLDGKVVYSADISKVKNHAFNKPSFVLFDLAVGGDFPGSANITSAFPQRMLVDYIRVFQKE